MTNSGNGPGNVRFLLRDKVILLSPGDNVAVARHDLRPGFELTGPEGIIPVRDEISAGHKVALCAIPANSRITKYAHIIGEARRLIQPGEWVHTHNIRPVQDPDRHGPAADRPAPPEFDAALPRTFLGYRRPDGSVGTRNYIAIVATGSCSSHVCGAIASEFGRVRADGFDGVVAIPHAEGCGHHEGSDTRQLERTLKGIIVSPNVGAVIVVALGCEENRLSKYRFVQDVGYGRPAALLEIQNIGGTLKTISEGVRKTGEMIEVVRNLRRAEESVEHLRVGLNCGGSDAFSGISANPALGYASDLIIAAGGTSVLAETPEIFGAEQLLTRRAVDSNTGTKLVRFVRRYQEYAEGFGATTESNPSQGNLAGGISNILEKSLGPVMKGGITMLANAVDYAEPVRGTGLVFMNTPSYDPVSLTGLAAGGVNVIAFTTGRGTAIGSPVVPVLKISSNTPVFLTMHDNIDLNAGDIIDGSSDIREKGTEIYRHLLRVASGELTKSELLGHHEFVPWRIGPVM